MWCDDRDALIESLAPVQQWLYALFAVEMLLGGFENYCKHRGAPERCDVLRRAIAAALAEITTQQQPRQAEIRRVAADAEAQARADDPASRGVDEDVPCLVAMACSLLIAPDVALLIGLAEDCEATAIALAAGPHPRPLVYAEIGALPAIQQIRKAQVEVAHLLPKAVSAELLAKLHRDWVVKSEQALASVAYR